MNCVRKEEREKGDLGINGKPECSIIEGCHGLTCFVEAALGEDGYVALGSELPPHEAHAFSAAIIAAPVHQNRKLLIYEAEYGNLYHLLLSKCAEVLRYGCVDIDGVEIGYVIGYDDELLIFGEAASYGHGHPYEQQPIFCPIMNNSPDDLSGLGRVLYPNYEEQRKRKKEAHQESEQDKEGIERLKDSPDHELTGMPGNQGRPKSSRKGQGILISITIKAMSVYQNSLLNLVASGTSFLLAL